MVRKLAAELLGTGLLALAIANLVGIAITGTSVNPARNQSAAARSRPET